MYSPKDYAEKFVEENNVVYLPKDKLEEIEDLLDFYLDHKAELFYPSWDIVEQMRENISARCRDVESPIPVGENEFFTLGDALQKIWDYIEQQNEEHAGEGELLKIIEEDYKKQLIYNVN